MNNELPLKIYGKLLIDFTLQGYNIKVPQKYLQQILNISHKNLSVFNIENSGVLVSINNFINQDNVIYVSEEVFKIVKHYRNPSGNISIEIFTDYEDGETVLLKPLNTKFLKIKDQIKLLQNYICHNIRILYPKQIFLVFSEELNEYIKFQVIKTNETLYKVLLAIDTDIIVNFDFTEILERIKLPEPFRDSINMYIPSDGKKCALDYVNSGLYNGTKLYNEKYILDEKNDNTLLNDTQKN
jgi:hypothetical protein